MTDVMSFVWKLVIAASFGLVWFIRLESRSLENTRRIKELELQNRETQKELKRDLNDIRSKIDDRTDRIEKILYDAIATNRGK